MTTGPVGSIEFACPFCEKVTRVPAAYAGKQGKCPGCQKVIEVPEVPGAQHAGGEPTIYEPPPIGAVTGAATGGAIGSAVTGAQPSAPIFDYRRGEAQPIGSPVADPSPAGRGPQGDTRPCPACGEQIKAAAKKCKFCGEFLDERLRAQRRSPGGVNVGRLASPWTRMAAAFLDNLLVGTPVMLLIFGGIFLLEQRNMEPVAVVLFLIAFLVWLGYHAFSWYLIATTGQNITKRWMGIKIVRTDGGPVDFVSGVLLRNWCYYAVNLVPYIGGCFWWAGFLLILGQDRRCLHDHIASTVVVDA